MCSERNSSVNVLIDSTVVRTTCEGRIDDPGSLFVWCLSNQQPINRRLNEASAKVEGPGCVGLKAHLEATGSLAGQAVESVRQQHAGQASALKVVLDPHRFKEAHERGVVEPEQRVTGDVAIGVLHRQIERRIVERALP